jgi:nicotinamidase-related amidase
MLVSSATSSLLIIDMQERLLPAMAGGQDALGRCAIVIAAAKALGLPVAVSEQYPKGLGHSVPAVTEKIGNAPVFAKEEFSGWRNEALKSHLISLHEGGRPQIVVAGIEAHVCVLQTAIDLAQAGFGVFAVADAIASRAPQSVALALERMRQAGVEVVNTEMMVFELLGRAGTEEFRKLSSLIR